MIEHWTNEDRYRPYNEWDNTYLEELKNQVQKSKWRLGFHIQPQTGLLNDPNGFSFFNNQWHLFYQSYPFGPVHGLKSWHHLTSTDLIHWKDLGLALQPSNHFDSHGIFSGSALSTPEGLALMYTGNVRDRNWKRHSYQNIAIVNIDNAINKITEPVITTPTNIFTEDIRDPQLLNINKEYKVILGAQTINKTGAIAVFNGHSLGDLKYQGELKIDKELSGYMIECPNLVFIDKHPVLLFCPQGLEHKQHKYQNVYPNTYLTGESFSWDSLEIKHPHALANLDEGFDIYATQAFNAPDGRALEVSWVGLPEMEYPTDSDGWSGALSLVKELTLKNGELFQYPVKETKELRKNEQVNIKQLADSSNQYELEVQIKDNQTGELQLLRSEDGQHYLSLHFDTTMGRLVLDRSHSPQPINVKFGQKRIANVSSHSDLKLNIFVDNSVVEIFVNNGEKVFTSRYFPLSNESGINVKTSDENDTIRTKMWNLSKTNHN